MEQEKQKRPRGRPAAQAADRLEHHGIRVTSDQWAKVQANGGLAWLRALIDGAAPESAPAPAPGAQGFEWRMTPHVCRECFGRVMERHGGVFRCSCCGHEATGDAASVVCCCGLTLQGKHDMGIRCQLNTARSSMSNTEIVAMVQVPDAPGAIESRALNLDGEALQAMCKS